MRTASVVALFAVLVAGCDKDPVGLPGAVHVEVTTTGADGDGAYQVESGGKTYPIGNAAVVIEDVAPGTYQVVLSDVASNCSVAGGPTAVGNVRAGRTTNISFAVSCTATTGTIAVRTVVTGSNIDPSVTIGVGAGGRVVPAGSTVYFEGLAAGDHTLSIGDVAMHCALAGTNPRLVRVTTGAVVRDTVRVDVAIDCAGPTGSIRINARTTGMDLDPDGYSVTLNGGVVAAVAANGSTTAGDIRTGPWIISLNEAAGNCTAADNPRTIEVVANVTRDVTFDIVCAERPRIRVSVQTSGADIDRNGYRVIAAATSGPAFEQPVVANGATLIGPVSASSYALTLVDVAPNCEVTGALPRVVTPVPGTVDVAFAVTCVPLRMIAYTLQNGGAGDIFTSKEDGSGSQQLTTHPNDDSQPAWSSTGRIAFRSQRDGSSQIYVMNADGSGQTPLTTTGVNHSPAWSPDGTRIAFVGEHFGRVSIYVMNADGSNTVRLTNNVNNDADPAWSPDGSRIAFVRGSCGYADCYGSIHAINPNGQGLVSLTLGGVDGQPAWSPDGSKIAFSRLASCGYYDCQRNLLVMSSSGGVATALLTSARDESDPSWSPTGAWIAASIMNCDYYGCEPAEVQLVRADGTERVTILYGAVSGVVFRP